MIYLAPATASALPSLLLTWLLASPSPSLEESSLSLYEGAGFSSSLLDFLVATASVVLALVLLLFLALVAFLALAAAHCELLTLMPSEEATFSWKNFSFSARLAAWISR